MMVRGIIASRRNILARHNGCSQNEHSTRFT